ncbi:MAG: hypothetical protein AB1546_13540, partial [bacterium]
MDCPERKKIEMVLNGILPDDEVSRLTGHFKECSICRTEFEILTKVDESVRNFKPEPTDPRYWDTIAERTKKRLGDYEG